MPPLPASRPEAPSRNEEPLQAGPGGVLSINRDKRPQPSTLRARVCLLDLAVEHAGRGQLGWRFEKHRSFLGAAHLAWGGEGAMEVGGSQTKCGARFQRRLNWDARTRFWCTAAALLWQVWIRELCGYNAGP
jgi:hypothetical protein